MSVTPLHFFEFVCASCRALGSFTTRLAVAEVSEMKWKAKGSDIRSFFGSAKKSCEAGAVASPEPAAEQPGVQVEQQNLETESSATSSTEGAQATCSGGAADSSKGSASVSNIRRQDIADFVSGNLSGISNDVLLKVIEPRKPALNEQMPSQVTKDKSQKDGTRVRYCNRSWFDMFPFASYSSSKQGIFCLPCVLFPVTQSTSGRARVLIKAPLVNWKDAVHDLTTHQSLEYHLSSEARMEAFLHTVHQLSKRIDASISQRTAELVKENRAKLTSIVKCLEFCGRNGSALRGHRDDGDVLGEEAQYTQGNFKSLVNFQVDAGDKMLKKHLEKASKRETYISKTSQNAQSTVRYK